MNNEPELTIIFDTDCLMCSAWVRFVLRHERYPNALFVSAWSPRGLQIAADHGLNVEDLDHTYLVVLDGNGLTKSDATFAIFRTLKAPWSWCAIFRFAPRPLRDWAYDRLAKNRYRWFGKADQCFIPREGERARFVSGPPRSSVLPNHR